MMKAFSPGLALMLGAAVVAGARDARAEPVLSPEIPMDAPILVPAEGAQSDPVVAFDGTQYLVVWADERSGKGIRATRVTPSGAVLDPYGIPIAAGSWPSVAVGSAGFLVVYESGGDVHGARVGPDGSVLDPDGFVICGAPKHQTYPAVASDGDGFLVVWDDGRDKISGEQFDVYHARVAPDGTVLDPGGVLTALGTGPALWPTGHRPDVAYDGAGYLVVWGDQRIYGMRVSTQGAPLDASPIPIGPPPLGEGGQRFPSIAFDGARYFVVWSESVTEYYDYRIAAARVTPAGDVLDPTGILLAVEPDIDVALRNPKVAYDGTSAVVVWRRQELDLHSAALYQMRVSPAGVKLDPSGVLLADTAQNVLVGGESHAIARGGDSALVVWEENHAGDVATANGHIAGVRLAPSGAVLDPSPFPISMAANGQYEPAAAFDGASFLVVWTDDRNYETGQGFTDIYGARVSPTGEVLDSQALPIATGSGFQFKPRAVFDGANTLVAWWHLDYVDFHGDPIYQAYVARVSPGGVVLDPTPIALPLISWGDAPLALASNGTSTLVAADGYDGVIAVLVGQDGAVGPPLFLMSQPGQWYGLNPAAASDGAGYVVTWIGPTSPAGEVYGARISPEGVSLDPEGFLVSPPPTVTRSSSVDFDGSNSIVVWANEAAGIEGVYGARIGPGGQVLDPQPISFGPGAVPSIACDGQSTEVAWLERDSMGTGWDIRGAALSPDGTVFSTFPIAAEPESWGAPALAAGAGAALVAYSRFHEGSPFASHRVQVKLVAPAPCARAADCASGHCVDGFCCNEACGDGDPLDCQACSVEAGSHFNGSCGPVESPACTDPGPGAGGTGRDEDAATRLVAAGGCDCRAGAPPGSAASLWIAALAFLRRRRPRAAAHRDRVRRRGH